jgi:hypothetical protein
VAVEGAGDSFLAEGGRAETTTGAGSTGADTGAAGAGAAAAGVAFGGTASFFFLPPTWISICSSGSASGAAFLEGEAGGAVATAAGSVAATVGATSTAAGAEVAVSVVAVVVAAGPIGSLLEGAGVGDMAAPAPPAPAFAAGMVPGRGRGSGLTSSPSTYGLTLSGLTNRP